MGAHIRIQAEGHTGNLAFGSSQLIDDFQLGDALYIEAEDVVVESQVNFPVALAHTSKYNLGGREACLDAGLNLASADAVNTQTCFADNAEQLGVGVSLDSIMYVPCLVLLCLLFDSLERLAQ